jgi:hypothetical protein
MVSAVGNSSYGLGAHPVSGSGPAGNAVAALEGQIRQTQVQLDDWTTCVSAKTPKGQAAIQKLSGQIGADREHIARALQSAASSSAASALANPAPSSAPAAAARTGSIDAWA